MKNRIVVVTVLVALIMLFGAQTQRASGITTRPSLTPTPTPTPTVTTPTPEAFTLQMMRTPTAIPIPTPQPLTPDWYRLPMPVTRWWFTTSEVETILRADIGQYSSFDPLIEEVMRHRLDGGKHTPQFRERTIIQVVGCELFRLSSLAVNSERLDMGDLEYLHHVNARYKSYPGSPEKRRRLALAAVTSQMTSMKDWVQEYSHECVYHALRSLPISDDRTVVLGEQRLIPNQRLVSSLCPCMSKWTLTTEPIPSIRLSGRRGE